MVAREKMIADGERQPKRLFFMLSDSLKHITRQVISTWHIVPIPVMVVNYRGNARAASTDKAGRGC